MKSIFDTFKSLAPRVFISAQAAVPRGIHAVWNVFRVEHCHCENGKFKIIIFVIQHKIFRRNVFTSLHKTFFFGAEAAQMTQCLGKVFTMSVFLKI
jgi:hypothetical protein